MNTYSRIWTNASFKRKLFLSLLFLSIVPVILLGFVSSYIDSRAIQKEVNRNHEIILRQFSNQVNSLLQSLDKAAITLANHSAVEQSIEKGPMVQQLDYTLAMIDTVQKQRSFSDFHYDVSIVYRAYGKVYSSRYGYIPLSEFPFAGDLDKIDLSAAAALPPDGKANRSDLLVVRPVPLFFADKPDGYVIIHAQAEKLTSFFHQASLGNNRRLLVLDQNGMIVMSQEPKEIGTRLPKESQLYQFWENPSSSPGPVSIGGTDYLLSSQKSSFNGWTYIAMTSQKDLTAKANNIQIVTWSIVGVLVLLWVLVSFIGSHRLYFPIQRLLTRLSGDGKPSRGSGPTGDLQALDSFIQQMVDTNQALRRELHDQIPYLKETVLQQLLRGEMSSEEIARKTERYGLPISGQWFYVMLVDVDEYVSFERLYREKDRSLMLYALRKMAEELFEERLPATTAMPLPGQIALILGCDRTDEETDAEVRQLADEFLVMVRQYFQFTVTVALGAPGRFYPGIKEAYDHAAELLGYRLLLGSNRVIAREDIKPSVQQSSSTLIHLQKAIVDQVADCHLNGAVHALDQLLEAVPRYTRHSESALGLFAYLIGELSMHIQSKGVEPDQVFDGDPYKELYSKLSLPEVRSWLAENLLPSIIEALDAGYEQKLKSLSREICDYVDAHLETDLSLQQVAYHFGKSLSQMSRIFKEETGRTFSDYLIQIRMEKAKEWLVQSEMPIKEIAERLRYTTVQNFTRVFKQVTDMPPGQYRKRFRDNGG
ncbi:hypothetical protein J31TS4_41760 [Paenibacillus sp. J31TS4]|uniref:helix-turn-helix domain-containing protein n=1 Tax=Paenibacillus sp. J31TS4 TaxID=2807195 RepID=UPI001B2639AF|nr:helix-turn-helix domain-containing protein [Paenibacillus sp. J31TS4]GIP40896.1 hypothetical protein J31TS4_41760 [Paenibacillus sp. J31TS4]